MEKCDPEIAARLRWVELYQETGNAGLVCRRCGISRPTLRKWWRRFQENGVEGLRSLSRAPVRSPRRKLTREIEERILTLRRERNLGPKRIHAELLRLDGLRLSSATIWKVLVRHDVPPLHRRRAPTAPIRYERPVPGDRVQMDTMKVASGLFQFTAIDDCSRMRVLGIYERRTAKNAVHFLEERVLEEFPFPIQRIQTDRGGEFVALVFQRALRSLSDKPPPAS